MNDSFIFKTVKPVIEAVSDQGLRTALLNSYEKSGDSLRKIEDCFAALSSRHHEAQFYKTFLNAWHCTHLKMLPIYGLSCRLQRLALENDGRQRDHLFLAAAYNAKTSHEDLNIDALGDKTHSLLYDELAAALSGGDDWKLAEHSLKEATDFKEWIYQNMVFEDIRIGLLTNMFSEIFNHGEYSFSLAHFQKTYADWFGFSPEKAKRLSVYIKIHVESNVEEAHFNCVIQALEQYRKSTGEWVDYAECEKLFCEYLNRVASIMERLKQLSQ